MRTRSRVATGEVSEVNSSRKGRKNNDEKYSPEKKKRKFSTVMKKSATEIQVKEDDEPKLTPTIPVKETVVEKVSTPVKGTLLDLADAAATIESDGASCCGSEVGTAPPSETDTVDYQMEEQTPEPVKLDENSQSQPGFHIELNNDDPDPETEVEAEDTKFEVKKNETPEKHETTPDNNQENRQSKPNEMIEMESRGSDGIEDCHVYSGHFTEAPDQRYFPHMGSGVYMDIAPLGSSPPFPDQVPVPDAESMAEAEESILMACDRGVPMDDLLKSLACSAGLDLEAVDEEDPELTGQIDMENANIDFDPESCMGTDFHQLESLQTPDFARHENSVKTDVFMGEGPTDDFVHLGSLDEISMDQLVGGTPSMEEPPAFQPGDFMYPQVNHPLHNNSHREIPMVHNQFNQFNRIQMRKGPKTKAAADRLRNLLHLPPEPIKIARRQTKRYSKPLKPPILNPILAGGLQTKNGPRSDIELYNQLRTTKILQSVPSQNFNLRPMTLAPVTPPPAAKPIPRPKPVTAVKSSTQLSAALPDGEQPKISADLRRHRYATEIAELQKPTPLEAVLAQTHEHVDGPNVCPPQPARGRPKVVTVTTAAPNREPQIVITTIAPNQPTTIHIPEGVKMMPMAPTSHESPSMAKNWITKTGRVKRPMNAFMVWARMARPEVANMLDGPTNADVSIKLGDLWREMTDEEKEPYYEEARRIRMKHNEMFPDWMYKPTETERPAARKHQSSPYWKNFVKYGNVEGFRIHTVPLVPDIESNNIPSSA